MTDTEKCGWNDIAHGILTWTPQEKWQSALEWALHCQDIAAQIPFNEYNLGCSKCVDEYQRTGRIERQVRGTSTY